MSPFPLSECDPHTLEVRGDWVVCLSCSAVWRRAGVFEPGPPPDLDDEIARISDQHDSDECPCPFCFHARYLAGSV